MSEFARRADLQTLVDNEAVCAVQLGASVVAFSDIGQVRTSLDSDQVIRARSGLRSSRAR